MEKYNDIFRLVNGEFQSYINEAKFSPAGATNIILNDYLDDFKHDELLNFWFLHSLLSVNSKANYLEMHRNTAGITLRKIINLVRFNEKATPEDISNTIKILNFLEDNNITTPPNITFPDPTKPKKR